jgi:hypothetical protein
VIHRQRSQSQPHKDLQEIILKLDALHPGDIDTQMEKLLSILAYCLTRKLFDAATLETLRADSHKWPESIQKLLAAEGAQ